ncbi:MAG TPA: hypothetical protein VFG87_19515 [Amycolatopsis sp.]|nr:hypothetical protein [Amycolatopsis sp.]
MNAAKRTSEDTRGNKAGKASGTSSEQPPEHLGSSAVAEAVTERHSVSFTLPVIGRVWLGEPKHLPFYAGVAVLAAVGVIEWPVAAIVMVGKLLADNAHREVLRDFGSALEEEA